MSRLQRSSARLTLWLLTILALPGLAQAQDAAAPTLPRHVYVAPPLRDTVEAMLARSPTFREQVAALDRAPALGLSITLAVSSTPRPADATIRRYESGVLLAFITIHTVTDKAELIAHEVEHVLEQVDGVSLAKLAASSHDAWSTGQAFETKRALTAGRRVASEMLQSEGTLTARLTR